MRPNLVTIITFIFGIETLVRVVDASSSSNVAFHKKDHHPMGSNLRPVPHRNGTTTTRKSLTHLQQRDHHPLLSLPRGGDLGTIIKAETCAYAFSTLTFMDGMSGVFVPVAFLKLLGVEIGRGSLAELMLGFGPGSSGACIALSSYLAISQVTSVDHAMAYGFLMHAFYLAKTLLTNNRYREVLGVHAYRAWMPLIVLSLTIHALFVEKWKSRSLATVMSILMGMKGCCLALAPDLLMKKSTGVDLSAETTTTRQLTVASGAYLFLSALYLGMLAQNVDPLKALGYVSLGWIPLTMAFGQAIPPEIMTVFGIDKTVVGVLISLLCLAITAGILL